VAQGMGMGVWSGCFGLGRSPKNLTSFFKKTLTKSAFLSLLGGWALFRGWVQGIGPLLGWGQ